MKLDTPTNESDFVWPDRDNTLRAIEYLAGGLVEKAKGHSADLDAKITRLINLVGLDRHPGQPVAKKPAPRDLRYLDREAVWKLATLKRDALKQNSHDAFREIIADLAKAEGFFSVWMSVFRDDADMRRRFCRVFKGTAADCFDRNWECVSRPGGSL